MVAEQAFRLTPLSLAYELCAYLSIKRVLAEVNFLTSVSLRRRAFLLVIGAKTSESPCHGMWLPSLGKPSFQKARQLVRISSYLCVCRR